MGALKGLFCPLYFYYIVGKVQQAQPHWVKQNMYPWCRSLSEVRTFSDLGPWSPFWAKPELLIPALFANHRIYFCAAKSTAGAKRALSQRVLWSDWIRTKIFLFWLSHLIWLHGFQLHRWRASWERRAAEERCQKETLRERKGGGKGIKEESEHLPHHSLWHYFVYEDKSILIFYSLIVK